VNDFCAGTHDAAEIGDTSRERWDRLDGLKGVKQAFRASIRMFRIPGEAA